MTNIISLPRLASLFWIVLGSFGFASNLAAQGLLTEPSDGFSVSSKGTLGQGDVSLYDGSLSFNVPLLSVGGRGQFGFSSTLRIRGEWEQETQYDDSYRPQYVQTILYKGTNSNGFDYYNPVVGYGPGVLVFKRQRIGQYGVTSDALTRLYFYSPSGNRTELRDVLYQGQIKPTATYRGQHFVSNDGSAMTFISDSNIRDDFFCPPMQYNCGRPYPYPSGYLKMSDGQVYRIDNGAVSWIRDPNGNTMHFTYYPSGVTTFPHGAVMPGQIHTVTDPNGRIVEFQYNIADPEPNGLCDKILYKGSGGELRTIRILKRPMSTVLRVGETMPQDQTDLFPDFVDTTCHPNDEGCIEWVTGFDFYDPMLISSIKLPDDTAYVFKYNRYGQLARVQVPTGGVIEYDHIAAAGDIGGFVRDYNSSGPISYVQRRVAERRFYSDGNLLEKRDTFDLVAECYNGNCGPGNNATASTLSSFDGQSGTKLTESKHYFHGNAVSSLYYDYPLSLYPAWRDGREYRTEHFNETGSLIQRTENDFQQRAYVPWWNAGCTGQGCQSIEASPPVDPRVVEVRKTDIPTGQISKTRFGYDEFNNRTDVWVYDFGVGTAGSLLKYIHVDYLRGAYIDGYNISSPHNRRLPAREWISSDLVGNVKLRLTDYEYDNYNSDAGHSPLLSRSNVVGHDSTNFGVANVVRGNLTGVVRYVNPQAQSDAVTEYSQYDMLGNIVKKIGPGGAISTLNYDDNFGVPDGESRSNSAPSQLNGQSTFAFVTGGINPMGWIVGYTQYDYFTGATVNTEDMNGVISKIVYADPLDRVTQTVSALGTGFQTQSIVIYDAANRRTETRSDLNSFNDNLLRVENFTDGFQRDTETRTYTEGGYVSIRREYDAMGRLKRVSDPYRPPLGEQPVWRESFYDSLSRIVRVRTADNAEMLTEYVGSSIIATDQAGRKRRLVKNSADELVRVDEPNSAGLLDQDGLPVQSTYYQNDAAGNLLTIVQGSQTRSFSYDGISRLISETNPELGNGSSGTIAYQYDMAGNLVQKTDARGVVTTSVFDVLNRATSTTYSDSTPPISFTYDDPAVPYSRGKMTRISSGISSNEFLAFDARGKVLDFRQTTDGTAYQTTYTYNLSGALIEQTYPSGRIVRNELRTDGQLSQVQSKPLAGATFRDYADNFVYDAAGIATSVRLGNGRFESYQFNNRRQIENIMLGSSIGDASILKVTYTYGDVANNGNPLTQTIMVPSFGAAQGFTTVQSYVYDSLNRLSQAEERPTGYSQTQCNQNPGQCWKQTFVFDRYGNRNLDVANTTTLPPNFDPAVWNPTVDVVKNRLSSSQGYIYDQNGNLKNDAEGRAFTYDARNEQVEIRNQLDQILGTYIFDGSGRRIKKIAGSETTIYVYDAEGKLIAEYSTAAPPANPKINFVTTDNTGTTRVTTDAFGQVVSRADNLPYGELIFSPNRTSALRYNIVDSVEQGYTGYIRDDESGLDYAKARMYSSLFGRFSALDAARPDLGNPQTLNRYQFCLNNPLKYIDKYGDYEEDVHRWLTMALAYAVGFNMDQATKIGAANQWLDDNPESSPLPASYLSPSEQKRAYDARVAYHFTTEERRNELWGAFRGYVSRGENGNAFSALGTFMHAFQDSYSHAGLSAATGQATSGIQTIPGTGIPYWWDHDQAELPDKTWYKLETSSTMARQTFEKLLEARNEMAASGKFGAFSRPLKYDDIKGLVDKWLEAKNDDDKKKIWDQLIQTITLARQRDYG